MAKRVKVAWLFQILRSYTGVFADYVYISEDMLASRSGLTRREVYDALVLLSRRRILHYIPGKKTPYIIYTRERQEASRICIGKEVYEDRKASYERRIKAMLEYISDGAHCRSRMLLRYFGEKSECNCGQCDVCLQQKNAEPGKDEFDEVVCKLTEALADSPLSLQEAAHRTGIPEERLLQAANYLLAEERLVQQDGKLGLVR